MEWFLSEMTCFKVEPSGSGAYSKGLRRLLRNEPLVTVIVLFTTMAIRWGFHLHDLRPTGSFIYHGSPISDGSSYTYKAISIANGYGIPPEQQPAIRPFYSIVLACLYTWTGFSLLAVTALNVVIGGFTAVLIYLCGRLVFNSLFGLAAALFFAIDPTQVNQTPQAGSEPLGLLFFVGSVYTALLAFQNWQGVWFLLSGLFIGLSNLTRTLTILALPFYVGLVLLVGWRERSVRSGALRAFLMLLGFFCVTLPWLIRQERLYGIASISDNIGEAIYAATSAVYQRWDPRVRDDADAAGIPNTIGDRYRYFIDRALENVRANPGFYLRNVGTALWEYANTFGPRSRAANRYANWFSSAAESQRFLLTYLLVFTFVVWLLLKDRPFTPANLVFFIGSIALIVFYQLLPAWATFMPMLVGVVVSWRAADRKLVLILSGSLVTAIFGSAIFANPVLFRTVLMTDWLFLFFLLAAIWLPAEMLSRRLTRNELVASPADIGKRETLSFHNALSLFSLRFLIVFLVIILGFFAISSARLIALTIAKSDGKNHARLVPEWVLRQAHLNLTIPEKKSVLHRLQVPPFSVVPENEQQFSIYGGGQDVHGTGTYIVEIDGFYYAYCVPAGESLPVPRMEPKPYARTTIRLSRFDFVIPKEVPSDFAGRPLLFVGIVVLPDVVGGAEQPNRPWVRGLAIIPLDNKDRLDFKRAVCAPPIL